MVLTFAPKKKNVHGALQGWRGAGFANGLTSYLKHFTCAYKKFIFVLFYSLYLTVMYCFQILK